MKTELGISVAVLSALAAQGKDFDRTEFDKIKAVSCGIRGG